MIQNPPIDHDRLFKELITTFFGEFVELFLPDVAAYLDRNGLIFLDKEIFTDVTEGEKFHADIVVRAKFREQDAFFLVHVEHQSYTQAEFGRRMFRYWARLFEKYALPVYPVVLYSFDAPKTKQPDKFEVASPGFTPLRFEYRVIQLNRLSWRSFVNQPNPIASALMSKMQIAERDRPRVKLECLRLLTTLRLDKARMQMISGFVDSYLRLNTAEEDRFRVLMSSTELEEREEVMEIVTSWMEEGLEKGLQKGRQRLLRQLRHKFNPLSQTMVQRVESMNETQLDELAERMLDISDAKGLEEYLNRIPA